MKPLRHGLTLIRDISFARERRCAARHRERSGEHTTPEPVVADPRQWNRNTYTGRHPSECPSIGRSTSFWISDADFSGGGEIDLQSFPREGGRFRHQISPAIPGIHRDECRRSAASTARCTSTAARTAAGRTSTSRRHWWARRRESTG